MNAKRAAHTQIAISFYSRANCFFSVSLSLAFFVNHFFRCTNSENEWTNTICQIEKFCKFWIWFTWNYSIIYCAMRKNVIRSEKISLFTCLFLISKHNTTYSMLTWIDKRRYCHHRLAQIQSFAAACLNHTDLNAVKFWFESFFCWPNQILLSLNTQKRFPSLNRLKDVKYVLKWL